jgi:hypothetical protein
VAAADDCARRIADVLSGITNALPAGTRSTIRIRSLWTRLGTATCLPDGRHLPHLEQLGGTGSNRVVAENAAQMPKSVRPTGAYSTARNLASLP